MQMRRHRVYAGKFFSLETKMLAVLGFLNCAEKYIRSEGVKFLIASSQVIPYQRDTGF